MFRDFSWRSSPLFRLHWALIYLFVAVRSVLVWRDREFDTGATNEWKRTVAECKKHLHVALSLNEAYFYRIPRFILIVWKIWYMYLDIIQY